MAGQGLIFGDVAVADAVDGILAHSIAVGTGRWAKGRRLTAADIADALAAGIERLTVAQLAADDVAEDMAAARLGARLAGTGVTALAAAHGRVNLAAQAAGLLLLDAGAVARVNAIDEALTLATLAPFSRVAAGEIVATIKIIPYAVPGTKLADACLVASPMHVAPFRSRAVRLIHTRLPGTPDKAVARADTVTRARLAALGCTDVTTLECAHAVAPLAALIDQGTPLTLIVGASATADRRDVVPAAIAAAGGRIERLGMPVDPGNLLCLGALGDATVIGLPGCARSPKRNGFDWVLERLLADIAVDSASIAAMGIGGLLAEAERPQPRAAPSAAPRLVGAIVLAAGRSTRMGAAHKLLADLGGKPLIAHIVDALAAAGLPPPVVVLGEQAASVRAALGDRAATFVTASDYADGLSRSLRAGIAVVPAEWQAALICLGDMPRVDAATLRALVAAPGDLAVPVWNGKRGNPVRWGRAWFVRLASLDGDVGGKALLGEGADATEVAAANDGVLADVDTPAALAALRASLS